MPEQIEKIDAVTSTPIVDGTTRPRLPGPYLFWVSGALMSQLGDAAMFFAIGWAATSLGGGTAGLVLAAVTLPRAALLLLGGAVADRFSVRRVLIVGDISMLVLTALAAVAVLFSGTPLWLLLAVGLAIGVVNAFYIPAVGTMPRRLVGPALLDRAIGLRQSGTQVIALVGAPLGAALVTAGGLAGAAAFDSVTFAFAVLATILVRANVSMGPPPVRGNLLKEAFEGVTLSFRDPVLRPALVLTSTVAAFAIPVGSLIVPLLSREQQWGAGVAGAILAGQALGTLAVALTVTRRGAARRPGLAAGLSTIPVSLGVCILGLSERPVVAIVSAVVFGVGLGVFVTHIGPLMLAASPSSHLGRVQALITLVQSVSLVVTLNLIGRLADVAHATAAALVCSALLAVAGAVALLSGSLRQATLTSEPA